MIIVVDGDNSPGSNVNGIKRMSDKDSVVIYYASDNQYYRKGENRAAIYKDTVCTIEFKEIPAGNCAVDLAVAMDMDGMCMKAAGAPIILISNDKHFGIIVKLASAKYKKSRIFQASSIKDALKKYRIVEIDDLVELNNWLIYTFGSEIGSQLYRRIDTLFAIKHTCLKSVSEGDASDQEGFVLWKPMTGESKVVSLLELIWRQPVKILRGWYRIAE